MQTITRRMLGVTGLALMVSASAAFAQQAPTVRVRGEITKVDGNTLHVKSRTGEDLTVKLAEPPRIAGMVKASLADIKEGTFIGVSAMPQPDGSQKAFGIHIFLDAQKGVVPDRFFEWDAKPGSTMTNANVATTVSGKDGQDLLVKYKDGEKKVTVRRARRSRSMCRAMPTISRSARRSSWRPPPSRPTARCSRRTSRSAAISTRRNRRPPRLSRLCMSDAERAAAFGGAPLFPEETG